MIYIAGGCTCVPGYINTQNWSKLNAILENPVTFKSFSLYQKLIFIPESPNVNDGTLNSGLFVFGDVTQSEVENIAVCVNHTYAFTKESSTPVGDEA